MTKFAWAARGVAAVSGAMLLGALAMPASAAAQGPEPKGNNKCTSVREVDSTVVDYSSSGLFETVFRSATDRRGHAFLNDSRNPGVWINLGLLANAPTCVQGTAVSVTEEDPGHLYVTLLASDGVLHQAQCVTTSGAPFTPATLPAACGVGFTPLTGTPV
ncbi:hypothetical protein ACIF8W_04290 [Streptomyces sp. NPDC085639]|uniref:hypothetical protein n=1 Tax=Streptomyces sp. NPDC085639 TaxID=3365734 RepID=UPI0037D513E7